jgi:2,4-dienoyl-CoA reductase-like NADH-dependent reductase (Old Yellow Enzyme family)
MTVDRTLLARPLPLPCGATLPNRLAKSAMSEALGARDFGPTPELERLYRAWSHGGTGLLITGNVMIDARALGEPRNVVLEDATHLARLRAWASAATEAGNHCWVQLNHPGRQSPRTLSPEPVAPSAVALKMAGAFAVPRALTDAEIRDLIQRFARAAAWCREAGFTGVQIHGAHGYLVSQFLSPRTNLRDDDWGGTPENRRRFLLEIVAAMRAAAGADYPIGVKLNSADFQRGGFDESESLAVVDALAAAGLDLLEISGGTYEAPAMMGPRKQSTADREAYFLDYARTVRARTRLPLIVTGGFRSAAAMCAALTEDALDVVGIARPLTTEPDLSRRLLDGTADAAAPAPKFSFGKLSGMVDLAWHGDQLRALGRGETPNPRRSPWSTVAALVWQQGVGAFRTRGARSSG